MARSSKIMNETINGLLSQKPTSPPPVPGQVKTYTWTNKTSKTGKPWIKIKNDDAEHGGRPCKIISAEHTDFVDAHGNISFNMEIEPEQNYNYVPPPAGMPLLSALAPRQSIQSEPDVASARRHIMQAVNLLSLCK